MSTSDIDLPSNRKFGFFFTSLFITIGVYFFIHQSVSLSLLFSILSIIFLFLTLIKANVLFPLNKLWMRFGVLIGKFVSPIVLGTIFFGVFTPISLLMKLIGRDELQLSLKKRNSHWKIKDSVSLLTSISDKQY